MADRLKIAERISLIPEGPGKVHAHSWTQSVALVAHEEKILDQLLPLLDGTSSRSEIVEALADHGRERVDRLVDELIRAGIVETVDVLTQPRSAAERAQIAFFSHFALPAGFEQNQSPRGLARSGAEYQRRLSEARVSVFGAGRLGARLIEGLAVSGVGHISVIDAAVVSRDDIGSETPYGETDIGRHRVEALGRYLGSRARSFAPVTEAPDDVTLAALLTEASFAVVCPDAHDPNLLDRVNRLAQSNGLVWTSARIRGLEFWIGPTILPGETACHTCLTLRIASNAPDETEHRRLENWERTNALKPVMLAWTPGVDLLVLEVVKAITWFAAPSCYGHLYTLDLVTMEGRRHPVLKIPRCPDCGRPSGNRPTIHVWQQSQPSDER